MSIEAAKYQYERDRPALEEMSGQTLPAWDELTVEQQENIRKEQIRYQKEMNDLGNLISSWSQNAKGKS